MAASQIITLITGGKSLSPLPFPDNKHKLIIKANGGIGFEVALQLLSEPSNHILLGSRSVKKGEAAVQDLQSRKLPGTVELLQIDVTDEESIAAAAKSVESKYGRYAYLVRILTQTNYVL